MRQYDWIDAKKETPKIRGDYRVRSKFLNGSQIVDAFWDGEQWRPSRISKKITERKILEWAVKEPPRSNKCPNCGRKTLVRYEYAAVCDNVNCGAVINT